MNRIKNDQYSLNHNWTGTDFQINKAFWGNYEHGAVKPLRHANIKLFFEIFQEGAALYGRTLKDAYEKNSLMPDHDDDIITNHPKDEVITKCIKNGFAVVRETEEFISVLRYNRYIDIHFDFARKIYVTKCLVDGCEYPIPDWTAIYIQQKYYKIKRLNIDYKEILQKAAKSPKKFPRKLFNVAKRKLSIARRVKSEIISREEFLNLDIELNGSLNWHWRKKHTEILNISKERPKISDILKHLINIDRVDLMKNIVETKNQTPYLEPVHLNSDFWGRGNNYYINPLLYEYRHNVMPYAYANLYINTIKSPNLFSEEYYCSLPMMTDAEIQRFLERAPIEIVDGAVCSGRHRVFAMIGRLITQKPYIPLYKKC
jgi:hypothetical protein